MSRTIWITGDQCSKRNPALLDGKPGEDVVLMIESVARGNLKTYHKQKLVLIYSVMRHFARELQQEGWNVDYYEEHPDFTSAVKEHIEKNSPSALLIMEQSEYGMTERLTQLFSGIRSKVYSHCNFISNPDEFEKLHSSPESRVTMESFYHVMRKKTGILMNGGKPEGGAWNYDKENRKPPTKGLKFPEPLSFPADKITKDVMQMVEKHFNDHPGTLDKWNYAVTRNDALKAADRFFEDCLDNFGPYQDAMLGGVPFAFHSVLSPYINVCLLHPLELAKRAEAAYHSGNANLSSVEGFIRQLIGWREYIWRVYWRLMPEYKERNALSADTPLPEFFWTGKTKMHCVSQALECARDYGYGHHILRLMVLGNFALLAGLSPLETNEWFSVMYVDGYDWVMVPNVIGMALHADNGYVGTKPYAASANYINKMSDYCAKCPYNYKEATTDDACPFNALYWDFLDRNQKVFSKNHRMQMMLRNLENRPPEFMKDVRKRSKEIKQMMLDGSL